MKISGLIVAAGLSSRMHDFKPLMRIDNKPLILNTINSLRQSGIKDINIVVGHRGNEIVEVLKNEDVNIFYNNNYSNSSMYDSFKIGLNNIQNKCDAIVFLPGDIGFVSKFTMDKLIQCMSRENYKIVYPMFKGIIGHPPIISSRCFQYLLNYDGNEGLKGGLENFKEESLQIEVPDKFILFDTDTKEDFNKVKVYYENIDALKYNDCIYLLQYFNVSFNIINHCKKVNEISMDLSKVINEHDKSRNIDINLISSASLLHDIKREENHHAEEASIFLSDLGYKKVSEIIKTHMDLPKELEDVINEYSVLYLADKLVCEDKCVSIDEKFKNKIKKYKNNQIIYENIMKKYNAALKIKSNIISIIGSDEYERLENKWRG